jgi:ParB-like chromosome segregation protein Spo0J
LSHKRTWRPAGYPQQIAYLPPEHLRPSANNARTHSKKQLKQIARSIERFGFVNPVLIADDFEILAGHGRVEAAKLLGLREVPTVRLSNLSAAERRAYVITDNRLAELAGWDRELLASELKGLLELQFDDIELTGFSRPRSRCIRPGGSRACSRPRRSNPRGTPRRSP